MKAHAAILSVMLAVLSCDREEATPYRAHLLTRGVWTLCSVSFSDPELNYLSTPSIGSAIRFRESNTFEVLNRDFIYDVPANGSWRLSRDESTLMLNEVAFEVVGISTAALEIRNPRFAGSSTSMVLKFLKK